MPRSRPRKPPIQPPAGCEEAWQELRALHHGDEAGWFRYIAGDLAAGRHVVRLLAVEGRPYRTLERGEAYWWVLGYADGVGRGQDVDTIADEPVPPLVQTDDAADQVGMSVNGIVYLLHGGDLLALYGARKVRWLFVDQLRVVRLDRLVDTLARRADALAQSGSPAAARRAQADVDKAAASLASALSRWHSIRSLLPAATRPAAAGVDLTPGASPDPWPIPRTRPPAQRCIRGLMLAHQLEWLTYVRPNPADATFRVSIQAGGDTLQRDLPTAAVLPYILGLGDARGEGPSVAYRAGLGY